MGRSGRRFRRVIWSLTAIYWLGIFALTHLPPVEIPKMHISDKLAHFSVFAVLGVLVHLSLWPSRRAAFFIMAVTMAVTLIYAAVDELTQPIVGRTCSLRDWYADAWGAATAVAVMTIAHLVRGRA